MNGESLWPSIAGLPLVIEACEYERLHAVLAYEFERVTTHVRLVGAGADEPARTCRCFARTAPRCTRPRPPLLLEGEWTLAGFCDHLATLELWPGRRGGRWRCAPLRNWAFESRRSTSRCARPAVRCTTCSGWSRSRCASSALNSASARSLRSSRCSVGSRAPRCALQARCGGDVGAGARRRGRGDGRGRHD